MKHHSNSRSPQVLLLCLWAALIVPPAASSNAGLVRTEEHLVEVLASTSRVVLGSSITITKELPPITDSVTIVGHRKACKDRSCYIDARHNSRHLTVLGAEGSLSMYNLELRNGKPADQDGGSILVTNGGSVELNGVTFTNNDVGLFFVGGAVSVRNGSSAAIYNSSFISNSAGFGGAVGVSEDSKADIRHSLLQHNSAVLSGGGMEFLDKASGILVDNTFENNSASIGGAVTAHDSSINVCGASLTKNVGSIDGPNIMSEGGSSVTVCRARTADVTGIAIEDCARCDSLGPFPGVKGDPHIRGPHGEAYDFHGEPETDYCLIADENLHLNMRTMAGGDSTDSTYIEELGLLYLNQTVWVSASTESSTPITAHQGKLFVDMKEMPMESNTWKLPNKLSVTRTRNEVIVEVHKSFRMSFRIVRAMYRRAQGPSKNFLNLQVAYMKTTKDVHGIFGKLYRPEADESPMQYEGRGRFKSLVDSTSYRVSGILKTDCMANKFSSPP